MGALRLPSTTSTLKINHSAISPPSLLCPLRTTENTTPQFRFWEHALGTLFGFGEGRLRLRNSEKKNHPLNPTGATPIHNCILNTNYPFWNFKILQCQWQHFIVQFTFHTEALSEGLEKVPESFFEREALSEGLEKVSGSFFEREALSEGLEKVPESFLERV